jgi:hypothetical protein
MSLFPVLGAGTGAAAPSDAGSALFPVLPVAAEADSASQQGALRAPTGYGSDSSSAGGSTADESDWAPPQAATVDEFGRSEQRPGKAADPKSGGSGGGHQKRKRKDREKNKTHKSAKHKKHHKSTKHKKHRRETREHDATEDGGALQAEDEAAWREAAGPQEGRHYARDTNGEKQHVELDSIYGGSVPKYSVIRSRRSGSKAAAGGDQAVRYYQAGAGGKRASRRGVSLGDRRARRGRGAGSGPIGVGGDFLALSSAASDGGGSTRGGESGKDSDAGAGAAAETEEQRYVLLPHLRKQHVRDSA